MQRLPSLKNQEIHTLLQETYEEVLPLLGQGKVADYIPALACVDPMQFGIAIYSNEGELFKIGDLVRDKHDSHFKLFGPSLVLELITLNSNLAVIVYSPIGIDNVLIEQNTCFGPKAWSLLEEYLILYV